MATYNRKGNRYQFEMKGPYTRFNFDSLLVLNFDEYTEITYIPKSGHCLFHKAPNINHPSTLL